MLWSKTFDNEIKEMRNLIRDIRRNWLTNRQEINPNQDYNYEYSYEKSEVVDNFSPCPSCGESKGRKKYVTECTNENGKEKGRAFSYCDNCGKSVEYDWDNTKELEGEKGKKEIGQPQENLGQSQSQSQSQGVSQNLQSESQKSAPQMSQDYEKNISSSQTKTH